MKVAVIGLGASGVSAAKLLLARGSEVRATDVSHDEPVRQRAEELSGLGVLVELGGHSKDFIKESDLVVASPGVSKGCEPLEWARDLEIPVISEIELASSMFRGEIIAITGTNGKTTVTTLVGEILKEGGKDVVVCGNIGNPFSGEVEGATYGKIAVVEVSSFQLEWITNFRPHVSVILNISPDHLDRHQDFEEYLLSKARIFENQTEEDYCLLKEDLPFFNGSVRPRAKVLTFSQGGASLDPNQEAARLVGDIYRIDEQKISDVIHRFRGIEHRLEELATINGVRFINDSKATNPHAVTWALERVESPLILIAGGRDKGSDFRILKDPIQSKVKLLILLGEARGKLKTALKGSTRIIEVATLEEAFSIARWEGETGDCVLLSPACASFDMFKNFKERGRRFKELVSELCLERKKTS